MTEAEVVRIMRQHLEGLFLKVCPVCLRRFATLREYLLTTTQLGPAMPYDAELGDWKPLRPLGTMSYATPTVLMIMPANSEQTVNIADRAADSNP